jgi:hypothetical protein
MADGARQRQVLAELGLVRYRLRAGEDPSGSQATLEVSAPGSRSAPVEGEAAQVWAGVLAWLGLEAGQVRWCEHGGLALPAIARWSAPDGKRGLWLALKSWRRSAG